MEDIDNYSDEYRSLMLRYSLILNDMRVRIQSVQGQASEMLQDATPEVANSTEMGRMAEHMNRDLAAIRGMISELAQIEREL